MNTNIRSANAPEGPGALGDEQPPVTPGQITDTGTWAEDATAEHLGGGGGPVTPGVITDIARRTPPVTPGAITDQAGTPGGPAAPNAITDGGPNR